MGTGIQGLCMVRGSTLQSQSTLRQHLSDCWANFHISMHLLFSATFIYIYIASTWSSSCLAAKHYYGVWTIQPCHHVFPSINHQRTVLITLHFLQNHTIVILFFFVTFCLSFKSLHFIIFACL